MEASEQLQRGNARGGSQHEALEARHLLVAAFFDAAEPQLEAGDQIAGALTRDGQRRGESEADVVDAHAAELIERRAAHGARDIDTPLQQPAQHDFGFVEGEDAIVALGKPRQQRQVRDVEDGFSFDGCSSDAVDARHERDERRRQKQLRWGH